MMTQIKRPSIDGGKHTSVTQHASGPLLEAVKDIQEAVKVQRCLIIPFIYAAMELNISASDIIGQNSRILM